MPIAGIAGSPVRRHGPAVDVLLAVACFGSTVVYLALLPRTFSYADEGLLLYEAKRVLLGDAMYRDFFEFVTPGTWYLLAASYALFGTTITTAKLTMACVHGLTCAFLLLASRLVGAGRAVSVAAAIAFWWLALPAWPIVSPHWTSTMLVCALLLLLLRNRWTEQRGEQLAAGALLGLLVSVQQHKGVVVGLAIVLLFGLDELIERRGGRALLQRTSTLLLGAASTAIPILGTALWLAGFEPMYAALVHHPLQNYGPTLSTTWGSVVTLTEPLAASAHPRLLAASPLVLAGTVGLLLRSLVSARPPSESRRWLTLSLMTGGSFAAALYYPDFIHLAFAVPPAIVSFVGLAVFCGELASRRAAPGRVVALRRTSIALVAVALSISTAAAARAWRATARGHDLQLETSFGRVDLARPWLVELIRDADALAERIGSREIYVHNLPQLYLLADLTNPTPYQTSTQVDPPSHEHRIIEILSRRRTPAVIVNGRYLPPRAALQSFLRRHYEPVEGPGIDDVTIFVRSDLARAASPP